MECVQNLWKNCSLDIRFGCFAPFFLSSTEPHFEICLSMVVPLHSETICDFSRLPCSISNL